MKFNGYLMSGDHEAARIQNGDITILNAAFTPLYLTHGGSLESWLCDRAIDRHRPNSRILKKMLRLADTGDLAAVCKVHAVSVTDNYWLKAKEESDLHWEDMRFSADTFSEIALTGSFSSYNAAYSEKDIAQGSAELTNIGSFEKCWKLENGKWWMYKAGTPLERFSEAFTAALGKHLGFDMADYELCGEFIKSPDFTCGILNFESAQSFSGDNEDYILNYDLLTKIDPAFGRQYLDILYMDALVFNMDRHTKNFGLLRSREDGHCIRMAPNYDNNIALISRGYGSDPGNTSPLLIQLFHELLEKRNISYQPPRAGKEELEKIAASTLAEEDIDRDYVITMILDRQEKLLR